MADAAEMLMHFSSHVWVIFFAVAVMFFAAVAMFLV